MRELPAAGCSVTVFHVAGVDRSLFPLLDQNGSAGSVKTIKLFADQHMGDRLKLIDNY
jgi:hypothetical protein